MLTFWLLTGTLITMVLIGIFLLCLAYKYPVNADVPIWIIIMMFIMGITLFSKLMEVSSQIDNLPKTEEKR